MGEINKAKKTVTAQKTTATPTTQTTTTVTAAPTVAAARPAQAQAMARPATAATPSLGEYFTQTTGGNVDESLKGLGSAFVNSVKTQNPGAFTQSDTNPTENTQRTSINLSSSVNKIFDKLNEAGVPPENALTAVREIFQNKNSRAGVLGKDSLFNNPAYLNSMANVGVGGGKTYDDDAIQQIAGMYAKTKKNYDARYNVKPGTKVVNMAMGGNAAVDNMVDQIKSKNDKIKVTKTQ